MLYRSYANQTWIRTNYILAYQSVFEVIVWYYWVITNGVSRLLGWCASVYVSYIGCGIYTGIAGSCQSCSPSSLSAAVQLLSFILSCLIHKHTHIHRHTHYSHSLMDVFAKMTLWSRRCFLFHGAEAAFALPLMSASFTRLTKKPVLVIKPSLCQSVSLAFLFLFWFPLPK